MSKIKSILKRIFCLPPLTTGMIAIPSFAMVTLGFFYVPQNDIIRYVSYVASAYGLILTVTGMPRFFDWFCRRIATLHLVQKTQNHPIFRRYRKDLLFRADVSLYQGMIVNLIYAGFKILTSILYHSEWFGAIGAYYLVLTAIRFYLIRGTKTKFHVASEKEITQYQFKIYRRSGWMIILLVVTMAGMIIQMIWKNRSYEYPGMIIYLSAIFTFYSLTVAIIHTVKYHKKNSPIHMASKALNLAGALMSILALQTAMFAQFGAATDMAFRHLMNAATGGVVSLSVAGIGIFMLFYANRFIKDQE